MSREESEKTNDNTYGKPWFQTDFSIDNININNAKNSKTLFQEILNAYFPNVSLPVCNANYFGHSIAFMGISIYTNRKFDIQSAAENWLFDRSIEILLKLCDKITGQIKDEELKILEDYHLNNKNKMKNRMQSTAIKDKAVTIKFDEYTTKKPRMEDSIKTLGPLYNNKLENFENSVKYNPKDNNKSIETNYINTNLPTMSYGSIGAGIQKSDIANNVDSDCDRISTPGYDIENAISYDSSKINALQYEMDENNPQYKSINEILKEAEQYELPPGLKSDENIINDHKVNTHDDICCVANDFDGEDVDLLLKGRTFKDFETNNNFSNFKNDGFSNGRNSKISKELNNEVEHSNGESQNMVVYDGIKKENEKNGKYDKCQFMERGGTPCIPPKRAFKNIMSKNEDGEHRFIEILRDFCFVYKICVPEFEIIRENDVYRCTGIFCNMNFVSSYQYDKADAKDTSCQKIVDYIDNNWNVIFEYDGNLKKRLKIAYFDT